jgi:methylmalonyl-CoA carboxyltransferase 12S subunit
MSTESTGSAAAEEQTVTELVEAVRSLSERVAQLEAELAHRREQNPGVPDDVAIAISAAVAAFLGHRAKIKQMHYRTGQAYAQQGRVVVQAHHNIPRPR